jgi:dephospho-CoA kinase
MDRQEQAVHAPYCVLVIPLLVETEMQDRVDRVLVVEADRALRLRWLCERDNIDTAAAARIMEAQADDASRRAVADDMVYNDGDPARLEARVQDLHQQYLALAG